jgi:hypothetical protein
VPGLHKFYTLAALYHLNPLELFQWFEIPIEECSWTEAIFRFRERTGGGAERVACAVAI